MKAHLFRGALAIALMGSFLTIVISYRYVRPRFLAMIRQSEALTARVQELLLTKGTLTRELAQSRAQLTMAERETQATEERERVLRATAERLSFAAIQREQKLAETQQELARWEAIGEPPENIRGLSERSRELSLTVAKLTHEQKALRRELEYARSMGLPDTDGVPRMPPLHGNVLAVDPKWSFVVVNLGETDGLRERGVMIVRRGGLLIGKVRLSRVEPNRSIGNILPEWQQAQVREGDEVLN